MKQFRKSDMIVGKHAYKMVSGNLGIWTEEDEKDFDDDLVFTLGYGADIIEVYELIKVSEIYRKPKEMTQEELIKLAEARYCCKVKIKEAMNKNDIK